MTFLTPDQSDAISTLIDQSRESGGTWETVDNLPGTIDVAIGPNHWLIGPNGVPLPYMSYPTDTETHCHCGTAYEGSDHCPECGCEQYECRQDRTYWCEPTKSER